MNKKELAKELFKVELNIGQNKNSIQLYIDKKGELHTIKRLNTYLIEVRTKDKAGWTTGKISKIRKELNLTYITTIKV
jgi:hypothetical protein